ncbi:MAG: helix-turn-helix domain-containing protein [Dictyoglomaceae bacterium]
MSKKVPTIAYILFKYGSLAKPFLNLILKEKIDRAWKHYFKAQKSKWQRNYIKALEEIKKGLNICTKNITLYYLLISEKILFLKMLRNSKADELFTRLRKDYAKIPILARRITAPTLFDYFVSKYEDLKVQKIRFWSKEYKLDESSYLFLLLAKARMEIKQKNLREGISLYFECFKIAKKVPHPTGILACLNDSAWYLKEKHPKFSLNLAKSACYYLGWYREEIASGFFVLDTLLEVQKITKDLAIFETINIINFVEKDLPRGKGWGTREHYKNTIEFSQNFSINLKRKTYENTKELREYLLNITKIKKLYKLAEKLGITKTNLSAILRGRTKRVKDETIRKFIERLNFSPEIFESPLPFLTEYIKKEIEKNFKKNLDKFLSLSREEKILLFISTYMSLLRGKNFYLSRKNRLKKFFELLTEDYQTFIKYFEKDYEFMNFFNYMFSSIHPLFSARRNLALNFLRKLPKNRREEFIEFYIKLEEKDRKLIDTFVRNYVRYDRKWEVNVPSFKELEDFMKKFHLRKIPITLSLYYFDKESYREKLISLLSKI